MTDREIVVIPSSDGQFHIDYAESAKEFYDISVSDGGILTMVSESDKTWTDYIGGSRSAGADQIIIQVPNAALSALTLRTTKEDISLPALTVTEQLTLSTNGGDISFENISAATPSRWKIKTAILSERSPGAMTIMRSPARSKRARAICQVQKAEETRH